MKILNWFLPLIEERNKISLGRISFWAVFGFSTYYWMGLNQDLPGTLMTVLLSLLTYNLGQKVTSIAETYVANKSKQHIEE